jgi:peroxidase
MADISDYTLYSSLANGAARTLDGTSNALFDRGAVLHTQVRVTPDSYTDGVGGNGQQEVLGAKPAPRDISNAVMNQEDNESFPNSFGFNEFGQFFGQLITHDITEAEVPEGRGEVIPLAGLAPFIPFSRTPDADGDATNVRDQRSVVTSFLDLDLLYGRTQQKADLLRGEDGKLLTGADGYLPTYQDIAVANGQDPTDPAVIAELREVFPLLAPGNIAPGDERSNQTAQISIQHSIWLQNHNYHAEQLAASDPSLSDEEIFAAARAITEAEFQWVVYNEYLPKIIGAKNFAAYEGYRPNVDPSVINEWAQTAFRFGHDQSNNSQVKLTDSGVVTEVQTLATAFGGSDGIIGSSNPSEDIAQWLRGMTSAATQEIDGRVVDGNRNFLFGLGQNGQPIINDLTVIDIARGRDHGVGNYNALRAGLGLETYDSFNAYFTANGLNPADARMVALRTVYGDDIDLLDSYVGGFLEKKVEGNLGHDSQLGETFTLIVAMQFERVRDGDRFYFENRMNAEQIDGIKQVTMADILARTTDMGHVYHDAFAAHDRLSVAAGTAGQADNGLDLVIGSRNSEQLGGQGGSDDIYGEGGNDTINGGQGEDYVWGGFGNDVINGQNNGDVLWGEQGNDTINGGQGDDEIHGGDGVDSLLGSNGDDFIFGDEGNDRISGEAGNDTITGGGGNDLITYVSGHDVITDLHNNGGERVIFANLGNQSVINANQWNAFLSAQDASIEGNDVVISFGGTNSLTLLDFADDVLFA